MSPTQVAAVEAVRCSGSAFILKVKSTGVPDRFYTGMKERSQDSSEMFALSNWKDYRWSWPDGVAKIRESLGQQDQTSQIPKEINPEYSW